MTDDQIARLRAEIAPLEAQLEALQGVAGAAAALRRRSSRSAGAPWLPWSAVRRCRSR